MLRRKVIFHIREELFVARKEFLLKQKSFQNLSAVKSKEVDGVFVIILSEPDQRMFDFKDEVFAFMEELRGEAVNLSMMTKFLTTEQAKCPDSINQSLHIVDSDFIKVVRENWINYSSRDSHKSELPRYV